MPPIPLKCCPLAPYQTQVLDGFNCTIFAYGANAVCRSWQLVLSVMFTLRKTALSRRDHDTSRRFLPVAAHKFPLVRVHPVSQHVPQRSMLAQVNELWHQLRLEALTNWLSEALTNCC